MILGPRLVLRGQPLRSLRPLATRQLYSTSSVKIVPLVYDLHEPAKPVSDNRTDPILFMHGLFGSKKNNRSISKALARDLGRSIYALDLRNHGESPHAPEHDYVAMADDVAAFIEEHKLTNPTLIGHSMGSKTAMTLALRAPDMIKDVVSVDNAPVDAILASDFGKYVKGMKEIENAGVTSQKQADEILQKYEENVGIRQFLLGNLYTPEGQKTRKFRVPIHTIAKSLGHLGDFPYKDPSQVRFEKPTLFVRGTQSKYIPDEVLPVIGQFFPMFECVDIDCGHWVISEKPEEFRQAVVRFLSPKED